MKIEKILLSALIIILAVAFVLGFIDFVNNAVDRKNNETALEQDAELIELAKKDIVAEYGFGTVLWLDAEKVKNIEGRDDFYIISCLTESDDMYIYRFAATIREVDGEIDVDTWRIKEDKR